MKIVVCVKQVPDTETRVKIAASGNAISEADVANWIVSPYDEFAIEEALQIKEAKGGEVVLVTRGSRARPGRAADRPRDGRRLGAPREGRGARRHRHARHRARAGGGDQDARPVRPRAVRAAGRRRRQQPDPGHARRAARPAAGDGGGQDRGPGRQGGRRARERRRPRGLGDAAAGRDLGPEGAERAALREPEGHHGRQEEADPGARRRGARPRRGRARAQGQRLGASSCRRPVRRSR